MVECMVKLGCVYERIRIVSKLQEWLGLYNARMRAIRRVAVAPRLALVMNAA
jgi:hypothetical protein